MFCPYKNMPPNFPLSADKLPTYISNHTGPGDARRASYFPNSIVGGVQVRGSPATPSA
jgi:hypothetical protein